MRTPPPQARRKTRALSLSLSLSLSPVNPPTPPPSSGPLMLDWTRDREEGGGEYLCSCCVKIKNINSPNLPFGLIC